MSEIIGINLFGFEDEENEIYLLQIAERRGVKQRRKIPLRMDKKFFSPDVS